MASADNWVLNFTGEEQGHKYVDVGNGVKLFDVRHIWSDGFGTNPAEKIGYAVHHAVGGVGNGTLQGDLEILGGIHNYHINHNGWSGIGYHRVVGSGRRVYMVGTSDQQRAHVSNLNHLWIGYCLMGTWTTQRPDEDRMTALRECIQWETNQRSVPMRMRPHKALETAGTACPGNWAAIDSWADLILQPQIAVPPSPPEPVPSPPSSHVNPLLVSAREHVEEAWRLLREVETGAPPS